MPDTTLASVESVTFDPQMSTRADGNHRSTTLDGLRGIAILLVLISHAAAYFPKTISTIPLRMVTTFGWSGVDLFFVLSGFLITGILIRTRTAANRVSSFYMRRILRISPIYYLVLVGAFVSSRYLREVAAVMKVNSGFERLAYFAYLQNWLVLEADFASRAAMLGHFWSLAVEEQFYLVWPFIVWRTSPKQLAQICLAVSACALVLRLTIVAWWGPHFWIHVLTPTRGEGLLVGSGLAAYRAYQPIPKRLLKGIAWAGTAIIVLILFADPAEFISTDAGPFMYTIGITGLGLLFGSAVASSDRKVPHLTALAQNSLLGTLGKYSYGMYVFHIPIYLLTTQILSAELRVRFPLTLTESFLYIAALVAVTFGTAVLSYHLVEKHFLKWKDRFAPNFNDRGREPRSLCHLHQQRCCLPAVRD